MIAAEAEPGRGGALREVVQDWARYATWPPFWPGWRLVGRLILLLRRPSHLWDHWTCQHCGYEGSEIETQERPWFECVDAGHYYVPGELTVYYWKGWQTCPRCRARWWVEDET